MVEKLDVQQHQKETQNDARRHAPRVNVPIADGERLTTTRSGICSFEGMDLKTLSDVNDFVVDMTLL
jgi:hypothetical protein